MVQIKWQKMDALSVNLITKVSEKFKLQLNIQGQQFYTSENDTFTSQMLLRRTTMYNG